MEKINLLDTFIHRLEARMKGVNLNIRKENGSVFIRLSDQWSNQHLDIEVELAQIKQFYGGPAVLADLVAQRLMVYKNRFDRAHKLNEWRNRHGIR